MSTTPLGEVPEIPGYDILETAGSGGNGVVYRAREKATSRIVAVKMLLDAADEEEQLRFNREAHTAAQLEHPNILPVYDFGVFQGRSYLVTRFAEGGTVADVIQARKTIDIERAIDWAAAIADALDLAHAKGLIHRDVKPSNMLLDTNNFVYLADFGLASTDVNDRAAAGSAAYMAPERIRGQEVGPTTDIYSLACSLFEMVTGQTPYKANDNLAMRIRHIEDPIPMAGMDNPAVTVALEDAISWGMSKQAQIRPPTAKAYADALRVAKIYPNNNVRISSNFNRSRDIDAAEGGSPTLVSEKPFVPDPDIGTLVSGKSAAAPSNRWVWILLVVMLLVLGIVGGLVWNQFNSAAPTPTPPPTVSGDNISVVGDPEPTPTPAAQLFGDNYDAAAAETDLLDDAKLVDNRLEFTSPSSGFWSLQPTGALDETGLVATHTWYLTEPATQFEQGWVCHFELAESGLARYDGIALIQDGETVRAEGWRLMMGEGNPAVIGGVAVDADLAAEIVAGAELDVEFSCSESGMSLSIGETEVATFALEETESGDFAFLARTLVPGEGDEVLHRVQFDDLIILRP